jgi:CBS domain-containing protein
MAIVMAQLGGLGVLHRNMEPEEQAAAVRAVKRFESGMVVNPITMKPDQTLADALELMKRHRISGIPVTEADGRLVGIITNRDVRFAENPSQPVAELMTRDNLVTVGPGVTQEEARRSSTSAASKSCWSSTTSAAASASSRSRISKRPSPTPKPPRTPPAACVSPPPRRWARRASRAARR